MSARPKQGNITQVNSRRKRTQRLNDRSALNSLAGHFGPETRALAQAITNPFSDDAIGAVIPDQWSPPTIPAMDRLTFDLDVEAIRLATEAEIGETWSISAVAVFLVPRSLAAGWLGLRPQSPGGDDVPIVNIIPISPNFEADANTVVQAHMYCLFVAFISTITLDQTPRLRCLDITQFGPDRLVIGYNAVPFSRFHALAESASGARISGAGLKMFSDEAPIETGGTVYGGWMPIEDIFNSISIFIVAESNRKSRQEEQKLNSNSKRSARGLSLRKQTRLRVPKLNDVQVSSADFMQDNFQYRSTYRGVEGVTVRYSPLQSARQEDFQPIFEDALYFGWNGDDIHDVNKGLGVGVHDLISTSDFVPGVVWEYNTADPGDTYSLRIEARVHLQAEPDGSCPFMTHTVIPDPHYRDLQIILENKDAFPVVAKGSSFRSFNAGLRDAFQTLKGGLGLIGNVKNLFRV